MDYFLKIHVATHIAYLHIYVADQNQIFHSSKLIELILKFERGVVTLEIAFLRSRYIERIWRKGK